LVGFFLLRLVLAVRTVNLAFLATSIALIFMLVRKAPRRRLLESGAGAVLLIGTVHASYLATALVEAGLERYTAPTWPFMIAAIILVLSPSIIGNAGASPMRRGSDKVPAAGR
jgi:hypothetical protein